MKIDGAKLPSLHCTNVILIAAEIVKPELQKGMQVAPFPAREAPSPHAEELVTNGSVQSWWHVKVSGVKLPSLHDKVVDAEMVNPELQVGAQAAPFPASGAPSPHAEESATVGSVQSWSHVKVGGSKLPSLHVKAVDTELVKPELQVGVQVAAFPASEIPSPHAEESVTVGSVQS